jgi:hypothetical protein
MLLADAWNKIAVAIEEHANVTFDSKAMSKMAKTIKNPDSPSDDDAPPFEMVKIDDLQLDTMNPRLAEYGLGLKPSQSELLKILWQRMAVDELAFSIAAEGYFPYEPIFIAEENGKLVVIEGNRRVAAVKLLLSAEERKKLKITDLPSISAKRADSLRKLPVVRKTREELWQYLGFKHVNGPAKWGSYAKAQYIVDVHRKFKVPLEGLANQIGDRNRTVQRLYRAMMVIEQAEKAGVYHIDNKYKGSFSFSHLYTGLDYDGFKRFLNITDESSESETPVPKNKMKELGELCEWLYGNSVKDVRPLIQTQNPDLKILDEVLMEEQAIAAIRNGLPLSIAHEVSLGDEQVFRKALQDAKHSLQKASGTLTTGFKAEHTDLLRTAEDIAEIADDLFGQMERKSQPRRRRVSGDENA